MKKVVLIVSGVTATLALVISILWIGAYNGAVRKEAQITESRGNVHATLSGRYEKVGVLIDAIESANTTVLGYLETITDAREAFADAIASSNQAAAAAAADTLDGTFVTLVAFMEDNPDSYNTVGLYSGFMAEFSASTNLVTGAIIIYNAAVTDFNTHIKTFPNNIFVSGLSAYTPYELSYYNVTLPSFD